MSLEREYLDTFGPARSLGSIFNALGEGRKAEPDSKLLIGHAAKNDPAFARDLALGGIIGDMMTAHIVKAEEVISGHANLLNGHNKLLNASHGEMKHALGLHLTAVKKETAVVLAAIERFREDWAKLAVEMHVMRRNLDVENRTIKIVGGLFGILLVIVIGLMIIYILNPQGG